MMSETVPQIPQHVAIIMDGNGRWAKKRNRPRVFGHIRGASRVKPIVRRASELGIRALTLYTFSTENWQRPSAERDVLWKLLQKFLEREVEDLDKNNVRLRVLGEFDRLTPDVKNSLKKVMDRLSGNTGLQLNLALSYGGRTEILRAANRFAREAAENPGLTRKELTEEDFEKYLWTHELGELAQTDLVIRTSGEVRISNFLLWQSAYAEYVFFDFCWPDFTADHLDAAVEEYGKRNRRYGGLKAVQG